MGSTATGGGTAAIGTGAGGTMVVVECCLAREAASASTACTAATKAVFATGMASSESFSTGERTVPGAGGSRYPCRAFSGVLYSARSTWVASEPGNSKGSEWIALFGCNREFVL